MILHLIMKHFALIPERRDGSTTSYSDHSLSEYESFCFDVDHIEEKSSGSTTSHSDLSLLEYESFHFDLSIDPLPPADRSDSHLEEFADELAHIISPPEYDHFYFDLEDIRKWKDLILFFSLTQSGEKTRAMETPSFSSHHMPSSRPAAYLPKEVLIFCDGQYLTLKEVLESLDLTGKKEHYVIRMLWEILKNSSLEDRHKFFKWEIGIGDGLGLVTTVNHLANGGDSATSGLTPQAMERGMLSLIMDGRDSKVARGSSLFGSSAIEYEGASLSFKKEQKPFTSFNACFSRGSLANDAYQRTEDLKSLKEVFHSKINLMETKDHHDLEKSKANRLATFKNMLKGEKYDAKGWCEKGAHKYGRLNEQSWWEKWGDNYERTCSKMCLCPFFSVFATDKWAETELGTKWEEKWFWFTSRRDMACDS
ncbi:hypothetical protein Tco_1569564 [Tanacetum coccineum]